MQVNKAISHILGFFVTCISYKIISKFLMFTVNVCLLCLFVCLFVTFFFFFFRWLVTHGNLWRTITWNNCIPQKKQSLSHCFSLVGKIPQYKVSALHTYISQKQHLSSSIYKLKSFLSPYILFLYIIVFQFRN